MTPEEELELAMLKSRVAEEEPPELPRAPPAYQPNYSAAAPSFLNPSAPLGPLPSLVRKHVPKERLACRLGHAPLA